MMCRDSGLGSVEERDAPEDGRACDARSRLGGRVRRALRRWFRDRATMNATRPHAKKLLVVIVLAAGVRIATSLVESSVLRIASTRDSGAWASQGRPLLVAEAVLDLFSLLLLIVSIVLLVRARYASGRWNLWASFFVLLSASPTAWLRPFLHSVFANGYQHISVAHGVPSPGGDGWSFIGTEDSSGLIIMACILVGMGLIGLRLLLRRAASERIEAGPARTMAPEEIRRHRGKQHRPRGGDAA